jgi:hypothetical protein
VSYDLATYEDRLSLARVRRPMLVCAFLPKRAECADQGLGRAF